MDKILFGLLYTGFGLLALLKPKVLLEMRSGVEREINILMI